MNAVLDVMNARILLTATLAATSYGALPAQAADSRLLGLVMPDAKVLAGVNVDQAKATPFGVYVLGQIAPQDQGLQQLATLLGFDPRRDVSELLVASTAVSGSTGLAVARGVFDPAQIAAAALLAGATSEVFDGINILEDPKQTNGVAFLDPTLVVVGDVANVKAAIDRQSQNKPSVLPSALSSQVDLWSRTEDAWVVATVPPSLLKLAPGAPQVPGLTGQSAFATVQQIAAGVKFGSTVALTAQAQTDTAENAASMAGALQFLANLAQMQTAQNPHAGALLKSLTVTAQGVNVNIGLSLPADQFEQLVKPRPAARARASKKM
jgi:hypothetical protein